MTVEVSCLVLGFGVGCVWFVVVYFVVCGFSGFFSWSWPLTHFAMLASVACLSSHSLMAISIALLRSPFFPPRIVTTASRSLRSVSSVRTMYILPKRYGL